MTSILKHHNAIVQTLGSAALCLKLWQINISIFGVWDSQSREIKVNASGFPLLACHKRKIKPAAGKTCSGKLWKMNIYTRAGLFCTNIFTSFIRLLNKSQSFTAKESLGFSLVFVVWSRQRSTGWVGNSRVNLKSCLLLTHVVLTLSVHRSYIHTSLKYLIGLSHRSSTSC